MEVQQFISIAPWTIIFQILNLLLLMVLFKKYLFKPVTEILEKRQAEIEGHYQEAQQAETDANEVKGELSGIALDIASQVIEREVNEKDHEAFIDEFIKNVGEAS